MLKVVCWSLCFYQPLDQFNQFVSLTPWLEDLEVTDPALIGFDVPSATPKEIHPSPCEVLSDVSSRTGTLEFEVILSSLSSGNS